MKAGPIPLLVPLLKAGQKRECATWLALWIVAFLSFWLWWLQPQHNIATGRYILSSALLLWITALPMYFLFIFYRAVIPNPQVVPPPNWRVAMVVTKAPSEPFEVVRRTLEAMLAQEYPHDTWLADEDPSEETLKWCETMGVQVSTRRGRADYHSLTWPRRTRCKEGNLAYFYDQYGYEHYDFVCQLDADHVPEQDYLVRMLQPFVDPEVGYVSAPSICNRNAAHSWAARSRLFVEATLHGTLQAGYSNKLAPLCIGSHYAVRTAALKEVGGLGPELAEDHSTTLLLNAGGWKGVHAVDAIARGDGPETFADLAVQEFQWSRSLMTILLRYTPTYFRKLPVRLQAQFLFCQFWYPFFAVWIAMYALPIYALVIDQNITGVAFFEFVLRMATLAVVLSALVYWIKGNGWLRPKEAKVVSWEGALFLLARWPWALIGVVVAVIDVIRGRTADFRVTPKGGSRGELSARVLMPYFFLSVTSSLPVIVLSDVQVAKGFYFIAALNAVMYAVLLIVVVVRHAREQGTWSTLWTANLISTGLATVAGLAATLAVITRAPEWVRPVLHGLESLGRSPVF
jgi:cellulose synthase (UDP-forming)